MSITVSAPGKIHLLGEHTVVYGKPALLAAIDKRLYVEIKIKNGKWKMENGKEIIIDTQEDDVLVRKSIEIFQKTFSIPKLPPLEIKITSQIPTGSGLGSSAALSSAVIGALMKVIKNIWNPQKINELGFEVEKTAHGNPSGADNSTVVFGGLVWFRKETDFLKSIWSLPVASYKIPDFFIIDTGKPVESTKEMVALIGDLSIRKSKLFQDILCSQEKETKELLLALKIGDKEKLLKSIKKGEENLEKIGVVAQKVIAMIKEIEVKGGAAKVCGAGGRTKGSGTVLVYMENKIILKKITAKYNFMCEKVILGGEGIRIEKYEN